MPTIHLLGISGSIRRHSTNTAILEALRIRLADSGSAAMTVFGLGEIPLYNGDLEGDQLPGPVQALQEAIRCSDGLVIASPEYNYGTSGVLKNALDWASRPALNSPLKGKPVLIMTASPASTGGARAASQIRDTLVACLARAVARPDVVIATVNKKIVDGRFADEQSLASAVQGIDDLIAEIRILRCAH